jgi:hypothetical protein
MYIFLIPQKAGVSIAIIGRDTEYHSELLAFNPE